MPKRGLGLGAAIRRIHELRDIGQKTLAQKSGLTQGYISLIETAEFTGATDEAISRIASALHVEPWVLLAQAAGLKIDSIETFTEAERAWLDACRELDEEQREVLLDLITMMKRPPPRQRGK